jgi:hypothetical protein
MRRAYPTSFCFQEAIEIILRGFFHSFVFKGAAPKRSRSLKSGVARAILLNLNKSLVACKLTHDPQIAIGAVSGACI